MNRVVIRTSGNAIDVSPDGKSVLPVEVRNLLEPHLSYKHYKFLRGYKARDHSGRRRPLKEEIRQLYDYDKYGRLVCGAGFLPRITVMLEKANYSVVVENVTPVHERKNRFDLDWDNVFANFSFRVRQDEALIKIAGNDRCVIAAATGFGKTVMYKAVALLFNKAKIIITTKRTDLVNAIKLHLSKDIPNIGQIGNGVYKPSRITVVTADSLHKVDHDNIDIVLGEEAHELVADSYATELAKFRRARMYAFTATPTGRMDNADMRLESLFGPVMFSMTYQEAVDLELVVPICVRWIETGTDNPAVGMVDTPRLRHGIWRNNIRNSAIAAAATGFGEDEQVLIMVTTFEHAVYLRQYLPEFTLCYAERNDDSDFNRFIKNKMLPEDEPIMTVQRRKDLRLAFETRKLKKVIATDVWSTGVSFNSLAVLIRADARSSSIMDTQIPGRVCRLDEETAKVEGLIVDCLDVFDNGFREAARKRRRNYEAKGWLQDMPASVSHRRRL